MPKASPPPTRPRRSDAELLKMCEHIKYEYDMLCGTVHGLVAGEPETKRDWALMNALLESFVIHARGLTLFFYDDRPRHDDIVAEDFFDAPSEWVQLRGTIPTLLSVGKARAGKEVAHLTYKRHDPVNVEARKWPYGMIRNALATTYGTFLRSAPQHRLTPEILSALHVQRQAPKTSNQ